MIGLDTSHTVEFTDIFQDDQGDPHLASVDIVAAVPAGSELPLSRQRVAKFTAEMQTKGVTIVDDIQELLPLVDAVMLESVDGSVHLEQAIPVIKTGKPLFIDKPLASSFADAKRIVDWITDHRVPCFSSSCIRFSRPLQAAKQDSRIGKICGAATWGPCHYQDDGTGLFFYGLHGIEGLFALMGPGFQSVQRVQTKETDVLVGTWKDGRIGTYRGLRTGMTEFGATVFGSKATSSFQLGVPYRELCIEIAKFFLTGIAPVELEETLEILRFMEQVQ
ncbi:MAG: Gfo/Idh/MocA family protein [Rubripirellula sp.]